MSEVESFAEQVRRLVKAKTKAVPATMADDIHVPMPKMVPTPPPHPPSPRRRKMASSSDERAVAAPSVVDHGAKATAPYKAMPSMPKRPPTPPARPSRAPSIPSLSSIPEPKTPPKAKSADGVCRLQEVAIVSRGSLCGAHNSSIPEFPEGWEIVACLVTQVATGVCSAISAAIRHP